jgi:hypothetical protein
MPVLSLSKWPAGLFVTFQQAGCGIDTRGYEKLFVRAPAWPAPYNMNLFNRDGLSKIAWLVHICALLQRDVIGQQLQWDGVQNRA